MNQTPQTAKNQQGIILTARTEQVGSQGGTHEVLCFYGVGESGPFCLELHNERPLFFIESDVSQEKLQGVKYQERKSLSLKTQYGNAVDALYFSHSESAKEAKDLLSEKGVRTFESDLRPSERFLMERFIHSAVSFVGQGEVKNGLMTYVNPRIKASSSPYWQRPDLSLLSFDIETSMKDELFSIAFDFHSSQRPENRKTSEKLVLMKDESGEYQNTDSIYYFPDEASLLKGFLKTFAEMDPDIIIGWHVIGFDLMFLERKCQKLGIPFDISRGGQPPKFFEKKGSGYFAEVDGRLVIDGPPTLRSAFYRFENFKLNTVASELLGANKDIESGGSEKVEEIERRFREDKESLAHYNLLDAELVTQIYDHTKLIDFVLSRMLYSGLTFQKLNLSTAAFDHYFLPRFHRAGFVASNVVDITREEHAAGGHVLEPQTGLHQHVVVLDFKSLYPSIIRTFKIDPYSRLQAEKDPVQNPAGIPFSRTHHFLPERLENLMLEREEAKSRGDGPLAQAIKILMNSFYGVMGSPRSRFYHADLPTAITTTGKWALTKSAEFLQGEGYEVLYGDTDSVFVKLKESEKTEPFLRGERLAKRVGQFLKDRIQKEFQVDSQLNLEFEKYYRQIFFPRARGVETGAKKRYSGLLVTKGEEKTQEEVQFVGMEFVRSDWTRLAKNFQHELFRRLFYQEEFEDFIRDFVRELKEGKFDDQLVYKKKLSKSVEEYTRSHPPHVKAALLLSFEQRQNLREVSYVYTRRGPRPVELDHGDVDYEHYIEKQIRPLAENVLETFDKRFDDLVIGDQLSLFH